MNQAPQNAAVAFGDFIRGIRLSNNITGRDAARTAGMLPSNFSKLEHGILLPPKDADRQRSLAAAVGIRPESELETRFFELAALATQSIAVDLADIITKNESAPLLLRTIGNHRLTPEEIAKIVEIVHRTE